MKTWRCIYGYDFDGLFKVWNASSHDQNIGSFGCEKLCYATTHALRASCNDDSLTFRQINWMPQSTGSYPAVDGKPIFACESTHPVEDQDSDKDS